MERTNDLGIANSSARLLPRNTVCLSRTASVGYVVVMGGVMATSQDFVNWVCGPDLDHNFLKYIFVAEGEDLLRFASGSVHQTIYFPEVKALHIAYPPLPEQRRIVGILDKALAGIATAEANAERNVENARAVFASHLHATFEGRAGSWAERPLVELCDPDRVITYGVIKLGDAVVDGVPCLRTSDVRWLRIDTGDVKRISPQLSAEYSRTVLRGGEVLVCVRGTLGGVAVAEAEMAGWNVSREVAVVPVDRTRLDPSFLSLWIGAGGSQAWLGGVKKGAAYTGINIEDLRVLPVRVPSLATQREIVRDLLSVRETALCLEAMYEGKCASLDALKQSLLHHAFTGQL